VKELKRPLSLNISFPPGSTEIIWQVPSYSEIFKAGSPPRIHGKFTTSPADHGTKRQGPGLLRARDSQNGRLLEQVPSYGLMGNVSYRSALTFSQTLIVFPFEAGTGKSVLWYANVNPPVFHLGDSHCWSVRRSSKTSRQCGSLGVHHSLCISTTSGTILKRTSGGYSHRCCSNFATSPIPTTIFFPLSIRHTAMVHKAPAMKSLSNALRTW